MLLDWQTARIVKIEQETHNTRKFFLQIEGVDVFNFTSGQFVTLDLPIHEKKNKRWRSYSIASAPAQNNIIELLIVLVPDGPGTNYMFYDLKQNDTVQIRGPQGHFVAPNETYENLFLICTGTGIAPFRSMLQFWKNNTPSNYKNIYLIMGTRNQIDLMYHDEMVELEKLLPNFHYIPTLSREEWNGKTGYVHSIYEELCNNKPNACFMLCGWKNMIDDARQKIASLGYEKKDIHFELYG